MIIQGGMGVNIGNWYLAKTVSMLGQLGVVSGVALEIVMARILMAGDPEGHFRRALSHFPFPGVAEEVLDAFYLRKVGVPNFGVDPSALLIKLTVCANFACVWLAKEGHDNPVGINYLTKIERPQLASTFGAMLAGVDYVLMGAGIPTNMPNVFDAFAEGRLATYPVSTIDQYGKQAEPFVMSFDPEKFFGRAIPPMKKPQFIIIVASNTLAKRLAKTLKGRFDGFVVEWYEAGGHNAPPRDGEVYGDRDIVKYPEIAELGLPFWIAGGWASPKKLQEALALGAVGIQVGSIFALCEESGMDPKWKNRTRRLAFNGNLKVEADMRASPTGYPFEVAEVPESVSDENVYKKRVRNCLHRVLAATVRGPGGRIFYRCASGPVEQFIRMGGIIPDTEDRKCICEGLLITAGLGFDFDDCNEPPIITTGKRVEFVKDLMSHENDSYTAKQAIRYLLGQK